jgi:predicted ATPase
VGTEGDAFFVAFASATDAVLAAQEGQQVLAANSPLRVRIGLHTGEAIVRDGDYVGHEVHRAKRIADAGHGGQILVSQTTADLVSGKAEFTDLGSYRLKDISEPEQLLQLGTGSFPPLRPLPADRSNLPPQRTSFVGRDTERVLIAKHLADHRVVTLTGVGGCGKTRLAIEVADDVRRQHSGGVCFVDLSRITDPDLLIGALAESVGIAVASIGMQSLSLRDEIVGYLSSGEVLLILDNCEHLIDACAELVDELLDDCPSLTVLTTSREALGVDGEQAFTVPSLAVVDSAVPLEQSPAMELFVDRAQAVRPGFSLTETNRGAISEVCRRLDGVPLAIELAAAQVAHLSPEQIEARLSDRFELLTGGRRRVQRQQTLGATLDWSHDLLSEAERALLRRLAVFPGDCDVEAAEAVGGDDLGSPPLGVLRSLVAKSLVVATEDGSTVRFRLLETIRLYAEEKLLAADESDLARGRHAEHYAALFESDLDMILDSDSMLGRQLLEAHNLRAALWWAQRARRPELLVTLVGGSFPLWAGSFDEGMRWVEAALTFRDELDDDSVGGLLALASWLEGHRTNWSASYAFATEALTLVGDHTGPRAWHVFAHALLCIMDASVHARDARADRRSQAEGHMEEIAKLSPALGRGIASYAYSLIGLAQLIMGDTESATQTFERVIPMFPDDPMNGVNKAGTCGTLARLYHIDGRLDESLELAEQAAALAGCWRQVSGSTDKGWDVEFGNFKILALASVGRPEEARSYAEALVDGAEETRVNGAVGPLCATLAAVAHRRGDSARAARLIGFYRASGDGALRLTAFSDFYEALVRDALGDEAYDRLLAEGAAMSQPEAIAYGIEGIDP